MNSTLLVGLLICLYLVQIKNTKLIAGIIMID